MGKERRYRPQWQVRVDAYLFRYADDPVTIRIQQNLIQEIELSGTRTIALYRPQISTTSRTTMAQQEKYIITIEDAEKQIAICRQRQKIIDSAMSRHFSTEERLFIRLYWLKVPPEERGLVRVRNHAVISDKRFNWLRNPDDIRRPSREYWRYRYRLYDRWWNLLFPDKPKEETETDYIEEAALAENKKRAGD